jgi:hypothetical protein
MAAVRKAVDDHLLRISAARFVVRGGAVGRCATSLPGAGYATLSRGAEQEQPPSSASLGLKFHSADFDQLKGKLQPFLVITKPTLLALSQLVPLRLDFGEEELLLFEYQQVWPSGSAQFGRCPSGFDESGISKLALHAIDFAPKGMLS